MATSVTNVPADQLRGYIQASIRAMIAHTLHGVPGAIIDARIDLIFRSAAQTHESGELQVHVYDAHDNDEDVLWEIIESKGWFRATAQAFEQWAQDEACLDHPELDGFPFCVSMLGADYWWSPDPLPAPRKIWRYHPQRQIEATPWGKTIKTVAGKSQASISIEDINDLSRGFGDAVNDFFSSRPLRIRAETKPGQGRAFAHYTELLLQVAAYLRSGKQIYDFPNRLVEMFRNTDVDDIAFEHVKLPYGSVYMHFGKQENMPMGDGWYAEGIYITEIRNQYGERHCNISVACCNESFERFLDFDIGVEPAYSIALGPEHQQMSLAEAIDLKVSGKIAQLNADIANHEKAKREIDEQISLGKLPPHAESVTARNSQQELDLLLPRHESFLKILRLAVNALVYLNAYPDDIETKWPEKTSPSKLRELSKTKDKKTKSRILTELAKVGFTPVHLCGSKLEAQIKEQEDRSAFSEERTVSMHWVRGHWRRQAHGPGNTLRKIIWRMPLLRGTRPSQDEEILGHIYLA